MISLRETVQFMCEIKINLNMQMIHTVKHVHVRSNNQEIECDNKMLGKVYLSKIFIQLDELLFGIT